MTGNSTLLSIFFVFRFFNNDKNLSSFYPWKLGKQSLHVKPPICSSSLTVTLRHSCNNLPTKYDDVNPMSNSFLSETKLSERAKADLEGMAVDTG